MDKLQASTVAAPRPSFHISKLPAQGSQLPIHQCSSLPCHLGSTPEKKDNRIYEGFYSDRVSDVFRKAYGNSTCQTVYCNLAPPTPLHY